MESSKRVWTDVDLQRMPESHDGRRYEIIDGDLAVAGLCREIETAHLGIVLFAPFDVIMSRTRVVVPDLVAVRADRMQLVEDRGIFGAPDLIEQALRPRSQAPALRERQRPRVLDHRSDRADDRAADPRRRPVRARCGAPAR